VSDRQEEEDPPVMPTAATKPRRMRWIRLGAVIAVVVAIGGGAVFGATLDSDPNLVETPLIGTPAPDREVPYLEKPGKFSLSQLRGDIVVVNFWASWCVACREEHPALVAAATAYQRSGVTFVGVVYQDRASSAADFLDEMGGGKEYLNVMDPQSRLAIDFGVFGVPETFFIDRQGRIAAKVTGASTLPLLSGVLDDMLAGNPPTRRQRTGRVQPDPSE
jgi:cytochrome c biogenesis protein CcmG/thiol:disulfide interchange protein DsbE